MQLHINPWPKKIPILKNKFYTFLCYWRLYENNVVSHHSLVGEILCQEWQQCWFFSTRLLMLYYLHTKAYLSWEVAGQGHPQGWWIYHQKDNSFSLEMLLVIEHLFAWITLTLEISFRDSIHIEYPCWGKKKQMNSSITWKIRKSFKYTMDKERLFSAYSALNDHKKIFTNLIFSKMP